MKIAIDISPLSSGHKVRGTGFYLEHLRNALLASNSPHEFNFFSSEKDISKNVDIVHYPYFEPFFLTLPLKRMHKTVVTVHDLTPLVFPKLFPVGLKGVVKWRIQRLALKGVEAIITDSIASQKDIVRLVGVREKRVSVAYLAAGEQYRVLDKDNPLRKKVRQKYHLPEEFVLYVGDVTANKNLPRLVAACVESHVPLVMVGKSLAQETFDTSNVWNADLVTVKNMVKNHTNIHLVGFVESEELVALYNEATVFAMPSLYEGFGLPILEAMASGCPVITSHGGSLSEVAQDAAYIVDEYSQESIAAAIQDIFFSKEIQKELREKGLKQVKKFSWDKTAQETIRVYEKVFAKK